MREGDVAGIKLVLKSKPVTALAWFIEGKCANSPVEASATSTLISRICQCLIVCKELRFCSLLKMIASVVRFEF